MDRPNDFNYNMNMPPPNFYGFNGMDQMNQDPNIDNSIFNPMLQYEQAYMYYRYLAMQLEYKIKCKEYEKFATPKDDNYKRKIE